MMYENILYFFKEYWVLVAFLGAMIWKLILMHFAIIDIRTGDVKGISGKLDALKIQFDTHDISDKHIEETILNKIDNNRKFSEQAVSILKEKLDTTDKIIREKLSDISSQLAVANNNISLLMADKIKK